MSRHRILHIQIVLETHLNLRHTLINAESSLITGLLSIGRIYFPEQPSCMGKLDCMCDMLLAILAQSYCSSAYCFNIRSLDKIMEWVLLEDTLKHAEDGELFRHSQNGKILI